MGVMMKLLTSLCFFFVSSHLAMAASIDPWPLIKTICFDQLHNTTKNVSILGDKGWKRHSAADHSEFPLIGNFLTTGLRDEKSALFISPSGNELFVFGPADNELYPNNKCLYATNLREINVPELMARISKELSPLQLKTSTGKRYGNRMYEWSVGTFERNLSNIRPINHAVINQYPNKLATKGPFTTNAFLNLAVVGLSGR